MDVLQGRKGAGAQLPIQGLACLFLGVLPTDYLGPKATPKEAVVEQGQAWQTVLCPEVGPGHQGRAWVSHLRAVHQFFPLLLILKCICILCTQTK